MIIGWHGTLESRFTNIDKNGFDLKRFTEKNGKMTMPGDLGYGTYLFIEDSVLNYDPKTHAVEFLNSYKNKHENEHCLLKVRVKEDESLLDLDLDENMVMYYSLREQLKEQIKERAAELEPNGTLKRGNFDGLYIEAILGLIKQDTGLVVKLVSKRTFTSFKEVDYIRIRKSNFHNGRELVIRDADLVLSIEKEVI